MAEGRAFIIGSASTVVTFDEHGERTDHTPGWYRRHGYRVTDLGDGQHMVEEAP